MMWVLLAALGVLGVWIRFGVGELLTSTSFPVATLAVNLAGAAAAGFFYQLSLNPNALNPVWGRAVTIGFLGALTTFSSFSLEIFRLFQEGRYMTALIYSLGSTLMGPLCVWIGTKFA